MRFILNIFWILILSLSCAKQDKLALLEPQFHEFDNGFKLVMIENHSSPMIASVIIVGCGSKDETAELNGAAHMLEHLLFNGTTNRSQKQLYDDFDYYGLYVNAQTSEDYTAFMSVAQKRLFEKALEINIDMLFNSTLPAEKLEKERGIVTEEIVKDLNDEESQMRNQFSAWFYENTPYERPVIGNKETIAQMKREEIYNFYKSHYIPNNMQAIIIGDFDPVEMVKLFEKRVENFQKKDYQKDGPNISSQISEKIALIKTYSIKTGTYAFFALPAPLINNQYAVAFDLWQEYYFGPGDRFEQMMNQSNKILSELSADYKYHDQYANVIISARLDSGITAETFKNRFMSILKNESKELKNPSALENTRTKRWVDEILLTEKLHYFGVMKSQILAVGGISIYKHILENLQNIGASDIASINNIILNMDSTGKFISNDLSEVTLKSKVKRSISKTSGKITNVSKTFPNGLQTYIVSDPAAPIFAAHLLFKGRSLSEPPEKKGIADLAHRMLLTGTEQYPGSLLQEELNKIGATVKVTDSPFIPYDNYYNQPDFSYVRMTTLDEFAEKSFILLSEMLYHPQWTVEELANQKQKQQIALTKSANQPSQIARELLFSQLYSNEDMGINPQGIKDDLAAISLDGLESFAEPYFQPGNIIISITSSLPTNQIIELLQKYFVQSNSNHIDASNTVQNYIKLLDKSTSIEDKSNKEQGYISIAIPFDINEEDRAALKILSLIFSEKISFKLREELGLAYSIGASITFQNNMAVLLINMGTQKQNLERALGLLNKEINNIVHLEIDQADVEKNVNAYTGRMYMRWIARDVRTYYNGFDLYRHNDPKFTQLLLGEMTNITTEEVGSVVRKYLTNPKTLSVILN